MSLEDDPDAPGWYASPTPPTQTPPTAPGGPTLGALPTAGGGGGGGGGGPFSLPAYPNFGSIPGAPAFRAPGFTPPDAASLTSDPGYLARLSASTRALEQSAAARGLLRTGGTLNDIMELGQNFASQEYAGAYQRALASHDAAMRSAQAEYMPSLESWRLRSGGLADAMGLGYQAQLQHELERTQPRHGGGGGGPDPIMELLPLLLGGDGPPEYPG